MLLELSMTLTTLLGKYFFLRDSSNNPEGVIRDSREVKDVCHAPAGRRRHLEMRMNI
ncbi:hypothetical protein DAPPUDRAFT_239874 [Daphnia pulex]|uniref:Uncharacterized protein n=1 Tax=Daphnia pulex TaxID=6669 RepID=E9GAA6_DAPPU|nr:hypothetical protein DAPPUDRAFT_239874 [Daphnia pulex]|eukprot:EFX83711.1 hypothetical protein DAPPUDRAFT_239874 [Daphnia pulex]